MNNNSLFLEKEPSVEQTLQSLSKIVSKCLFIKKLYRIYQYNDEPKIFQYAASLDYNEKNTDGSLNTSKRSGGSSFISKEHAFLKCFCEGLERYACSVYKTSDLKYGRYKDLTAKAIDPESVTGFAPEQKQTNHYSFFNFNNNSQFSWVKGKSIDGENYYLPTQLIYFTYKFRPNEGKIYIPISTGAAGGGCISAALVRAILEVVERDSFMIYYLNKLHGSKVDLNLISDPTLKKILSILKRYKLEVHVIDITTDLNIPTFASIIVDRTNIGPAIQIGLKASLNPINAIIESIHEALHIRNWIRQVYEDEYDKYKDLNPNNIKSVEERGMYWYKIDMLKYLDFWLNQKSEPLKYSITNTNNSGEILKILINVFKKLNYELYYIDITLPLLKNTGYKIFKVVIPKLQPLYLHEAYRLLGGHRLYEVPAKLGYKKKTINELNQIPHPFL